MFGLCEHHSQRNWNELLLPYQMNDEKCKMKSPPHFNPSLLCIYVSFFGRKLTAIHHNISPAIHFWPICNPIQFLFILALEADSWWSSISTQRTAIGGYNSALTALHCYRNGSRRLHLMAQQRSITHFISHYAYTSFSTIFHRLVCRIWCALKKCVHYELRFRTITLISLFKQCERREENLFLPVVCMCVDFCKPSMGSISLYHVSHWEYSIFVTKTPSSHQ